MTVIPAQHVPLLDVHVTPLRREELLQHVHTAASQGRRLIIAGHNLHSVYLWHRLPEFKEFYDRADAVLIDGMPVLALMRLHAARAGRDDHSAGQEVDLCRAHRIGSTDWIDGIAHVEGVARVTTLGGTPEASEAVRRHFEGLGGRVWWQTIPADPWRATDLEPVCERIRRHDPQVLLIGMGMPLQERLAWELADRLDVPVIATVGGALDQLGGVQSLAPRRLGSLGLEWLWRLASDPRRLASRYLVEPVKLAALLVRRAA